MDPLTSWLRPTLFLFDLEIVKRIYAESYEYLSDDIKDALKDRTQGYLGDIWRSLDLLLCMHAYRDLQYGPKGDRKTAKKMAKLRKRLKFGWIAYNMYAGQKLLDNWDQVKKELQNWYNDEGYRYRDEEMFKEFVRFLYGYTKTIIAELSVIYVYLHKNRPIMPLGFMQHLITLGASGPTIGDLIDIETLTFIEVKSKGPGRIYKWDLLSLSINTRMPSAVAIPRYDIDMKRKTVRKNSIVVELYTLATVGSMEPWVEKKEVLEAPIYDEFKPLMQNISVLKENARELLEELTGKKR